MELTTTVDHNLLVKGHKFGLKDDLLFELKAGDKFEVRDDIAELLVRSNPGKYLKPEEPAKAETAFVAEEAPADEGRQEVIAAFPYSEEELNELTAEELLQMAKDLGVKVAANAKKETIVKKILEANAAAE